MVSRNEKREGSCGRIAFVTNFCPHYRVKTFETLARYHDVDYCFYSAGDEWYWEHKHGTSTGNFRFQYLKGFRIGGICFTPALPWKLWRGDYDVYIKCINGRFALPITYLVARLRRKPFVLWTGIWMTLQTRFHRLIFPLTRYIYRHADALVVYGEHVKRYLIEQAVHERKIFVAPHAVDNQFYSRPVPAHEVNQLRTALGLNPDDRLILYLGRIEEGKGVQYLIHAFADARPDKAVLVIAGDGSRKSSLQEEAHALGIDSQVRFVGYVPPPQTLPLLSASYVMVLPSITTPRGKELWGLVVNEAMNQGLPVIATEAVGAAVGGLVQDGVNGFVVPERDSAALARALREILDNHEFRMRLSRNARRCIAEWDNEGMVRGFRQAMEFVARPK